MLSKLRGFLEDMTAEDTMRALVGGQQSFSAPAVRNTLRRLIKALDEDPDITATIIPPYIPLTLIPSGEVIMGGSRQAPTDSVGRNDPYIHGAMALFGMCDEDWPCYPIMAKAIQLRGMPGLQELVSVCEPQGRRGRRKDVGRSCNCLHIEVYAGASLATDSNTEKSLSIPGRSQPSHLVFGKVASLVRHPSVTSSMPRKLLLLTKVGRGHASALLAVAEDLLQRKARIEIHFATLNSLQTEVYSLWENAENQAATATPIDFHRLQGLKMEAGFMQYFSTTFVPCRDSYLPESYLRPLGIRTTMRAIRDTMTITVPYSGTHMQILFNSVASIITSLTLQL
ncbi:hypothetical protein MAC_05905 [Metarhizium acridum CQMa 102]|uniref:Uncharacterized protein n=1 Tax=Metarhizium acridum (strain CQMa 102) TaxID=655827 RepID=E9E7Q7_METAQ|nr:uncharacterized protein MAC_05905 [Metarhizium acridum CQMa 102]EFY88041.1 hypothetical protein MAC_05905 [Metarhizium acridum CQMa 102]